MGAFLFFFFFTPHPNQASNLSASVSQSCLSSSHFLFPSLDACLLGSHQPRLPSPLTSIISNCCSFWPLPLYAFLVSWPIFSPFYLLLFFMLLAFTEKCWSFTVISNQVKCWYSVTFRFFGYHLFLFVVGFHESPGFLTSKFCLFQDISCFGKLRASEGWSLNSCFILSTMLINFYKNHEI